MISRWLSGLEERHLADLTFTEVARALRALSSNYVERRERLASRGALDSAGKRAAYALYYSPLHLLTVDHIVTTLELDAHPVRHIVDLGCGCGAAGASWAARLKPAAFVTAVDSHPWALSEAIYTYRSWGLESNVKRGDATRIHIPRSADGVIAGWLINELPDASREAVKGTLLAAASRGLQLLIVEPIATQISPWWSDWVRAFAASGGRADEWRFRAELPDLVERLGHAAGLRLSALTARSIYSGGV
jgi:hypothetical protein